MERNLQVIEKPIPRQEDGSLQVHSIWYTIQGEGPYAGRPAAFVRLTGCNLQCPLCDTEYTATRTRMSALQVILAAAQAVADARSWDRFLGPVSIPSQHPVLVLTGGEPFRQHLQEFLTLCSARGVLVQIETNGTLGPDYLPDMIKTGHRLPVIVCSPKAGLVQPRLYPFIAAYKYVLDYREVSPEDGLPTSVLGNGIAPARPHEGFEGVVYVQPLDSQDTEENEAHLAAAVKSCMRYGYTLCMQLHKIVGLD